MPAETGGASSRDLIVLGSVLVVGAIGALLDTTIVAIAIDDLSDAFSRSVAATQWVTTAYLLAMGIVIPLMGWLTDRWGARRLWLACLAVFGSGSVLCSAAWSLETLVVARVIQGLGGGLMLPLVQAILTRAAGPQRIGRVMGGVGIPGQLAPILGPVLGGLILGQWGWNWLFLINVPVCVTAILLAWRVLPDDRPQGAKARVGLVGAALLVPSCCAILWGLSSFETGGDGSLVAPVVAMLAGAVLLIGFVAHARHRREQALVDVRLLGERTFATGAAMTFLFGASLYGAMILLPLFYQRFRDLPVSEVGVLLAPQGLGTMAALWIAGRAADRHGPRVVGLLGAAASLAALVAFAAIGADAPIALLGCALVFLGGGLATMGVAATAGASAA
ncbi:MAG: DHA2 family efflux MFS transporter permease subunit [Carbonactinosporaceae bacterium]